MTFTSACLKIMLIPIVPVAGVCDWKKIYEERERRGRRSDTGSSNHRRRRRASQTSKAELESGAERSSPPPPYDRFQGAARLCEASFEAGVLQDSRCAIFCFADSRLKGVEKRGGWCITAY